MANKRAEGPGPNSTPETAAQQGASKKGAGSAGETSSPRSGRTGTSTKSEGKGAAPKRAAAKASDGRARRTTGTGAGAGRGSRSAPDLKKDLRDFAGARPDGWSHEDWLRFLDDLQARGHNINDRDAIGSMLERERLALALERIPGVGPQRVRSIADRYGYLWRLRETDADQLSREADVPKSVAEKVVAALGG